MYLARFRVGFGAPHYLIGVRLMTKKKKISLEELAENRLPPELNESIENMEEQIDKSGNKSKVARFIAYSIVGTALALILINMGASIFADLERAQLVQQAMKEGLNYISNIVALIVGFYFGRGVKTN